MKIEIRADGAHISGYVNVTEKKSRPVITPHGKVVEEIEPRAFEAAINRAGNINVTVDHDDTHIYASTSNGTLKLYEDNKLSDGRRREGEYFMQSAIESEEGAARNAVHKTLIEKLDKEWAKRQ